MSNFECNIIISSESHQKHTQMHIHTLIHIQRDIAYERLSCVSLLECTCWHYRDFNLSASFGRCLITKFEFICIEMVLVCELFLARHASLSIRVAWASYTMYNLSWHTTLHTSKFIRLWTRFPLISFCRRIIKKYATLIVYTAIGEHYSEL